VRVPKFAPQDLERVTFAMPGDDGLQYSAKVIKKIKDFDTENHKRIKFLVEVADHEEIISYTELCDLIERQDTPPEDKIWMFKEIIDHQWPLKPGHKDYLGSKWNLKVLWEDNSTTWELLIVISKDDPVSCATYGEKHNLLNQPGWKMLNKFANRMKKLTRMIAQSKRKRKGPILKFGFNCQGT